MGDRLRIKIDLGFTIIRLRLASFHHKFNATLFEGYSRIKLLNVEILFGHDNKSNNILTL